MKATLIPCLAAILLFACQSPPNADETKASMDRYWQFYKAENYDSLSTFYIDRNLGEIQYIIDSLHKNFGEVKHIKFTSQRIHQSATDELTIALSYSILYQKTFIAEEFVFKKEKDGIFRIREHSFIE
jgi:hypothetical protein